jgi:hypothetical protein
MILLSAALLTLAACGGRFAGLNNCAADGSVVWMEYPNAQGNYDTLNTGPCK